MAAQVAIADQVLKLVKNKWFWIILGSIIVLLILRKNWVYIKAKFSKSYGDFSGEPILDARKTELEGMASNLYNEIYELSTGTTGSRSTAMDMISGLNDDELLYTARYYKKALTRGNSMYIDVDNELMPFTNSDETLMRRLSKIGQLV